MDHGQNTTILNFYAGNPERVAFRLYVNTIKMPVYINQPTTVQ